jgi:hypothetical protein
MTLAAPEIVPPPERLQIVDPVRALSAMNWPL